LLVTTLDHSNYVGKIAVGRLSSGRLRKGQAVVRIDHQGNTTAAKVSQIFVFRNLQRLEQEEVEAGDIVAVAGLPDVAIGETIADVADPRPLPPISVEAPTVRMTFSINNSPFTGQEGQFVTSRQLRERLYRELERNVALQVQDLDSSDGFVVSGRGELHLAILIETMRREGYEFSVSRPEVIFQDGAQGPMEPVEHVFIEVPNEFLGLVTEMMGRRRGQLRDMRYGEDGTVYVEYFIPTRGLLGFRQPFLTATRGTGLLHALFHGYEPLAGSIETRDRGSLIALESGTVTSYALTNAQHRGVLFVRPGDEVYSGQVVGQHTRGDDLVINVCKTKHLTNHRKAFAEITEGIAPPHIFSLDDAIEYLGSDELLEVTPAAIRIRKTILDHNARAKKLKQAKKEES